LPLLLLDRVHAIERWESCDWRRQRIVDKSVQRRSGDFHQQSVLRLRRGSCTGFWSAQASVSNGL